MRLLCLEANKQSTNSGAMLLSRKEKQMKKLQTNDRGIGAGQPFKPTTPIAIYQERRIPMNRHTRRIILSMAAVVLAGLAMAAPRPATAQYAFTTIDFPGSTRTSLVQMNDRGQAVGIGRIPSEGATTPYGFIWQNGVINDVSFPGAFGTGLDGINEQGDVCGFTTDEAGGLTHAMMRVNGVFSHVEPPGAIDSIALSINSRGQVAGWYDDALGITHGFIYYRGVFTTIYPPDSLGSEVTTIDNSGLISGDYIGL